MSYVQYPGPLRNRPDFIIPPSNDVRSLLLEAFAEAEVSETPYSIYLEPGLHVYPDADCIQYSGSNTTLYGAGSSSVILSHAANNQWVLEVLSPSAIVPININNTTALQTSVTTTTASEAGPILQGVPIMVIGIDSDGVKHCTPNFAATNGNASTGVIQLTSPLTYTLTSAKIRYYSQAQNNTFRDFKIVHDSEITCHSFGMLYAYRPTLLRIEGDGGGAVTGSMNFATIGGCLYPTMQSCVAYDYNSVEHYEGNDSCSGMFFPDTNYGGVFNGNSFDSNGNLTLTSANNWEIGEAQESCTFNNNQLTNDGGQSRTHIYIGSTASLTNCTFNNNSFNDSLRWMVYGANAAYFVNTTFNGNTFDTVQEATFYPGFQIINPTYDTGLELVGNSFLNIPSDAANWATVHSPTVSGNTVTNCAGPIYINGVPV